MIAPLAKFIDWSGLQAASCIFGLRPYIFGLRHYILGLRHVPKIKWKLEEALEFLNGPEFIPAESEPAQLEFGPDISGGRFRFFTPRPSKVQENNIVYGRLYRCAQRWQHRPVIVLLDGSPPVGYHCAFPLLARRFNRAGFNVAALVAPYDLKRHPRRPFEWDCLQYAQAIAQNVAEIRALTGWLLDEGCPSVGLLGISYGGWLAGLTACGDTRIACAVLTIPVVRMRFPLPVVCRQVRQSLQALTLAHEALDTTRLNLALSTPAIPKENILLIEAIHDLLAQPVEELWQKWQHPEIWRLPHGHVSAALIALMPSFSRRMLDWLTQRLQAGRK